MSKVNWGKPDIYIKDLETVGAKWKKIPTPVQDSTELAPEKGEKLEAPIEGGENEDVKYKANKYTLAYAIRRLKGRAMPYADVDGVIDHRYAVAIVPEDPTAVGCIIDNSTVSAEDDYKCADGAKTTYTHDVLKPDSGNSVKWGTVNVGSADSNGEIESITITEYGSVLNFNAVSTSGDGYGSSNPASLGWYERMGEEGDYTYRQTWDTTPMSGKTYYTAGS